MPLTVFRSAELAAHAADASEAASGELREYLRVERVQFGELGWWHLGATAAVATAAGEHGGAVRGRRTDPWHTFGDKKSTTAATAVYGFTSTEQYFFVRSGFVREWAGQVVVETKGKRGAYAAPAIS